MVSANPTGPVTVASARNGAYGDSRRAPARLRRATRSSASTTTTTRARRWSASGLGRGAPARGGAARGRLPRRLRRRARPAPGRSRARDARAGSRRRWSGSGSTSTRWAKQSELERRLAEYLPRLDTYEKDGAVWARSSAYGDEDDRVLIRSETGAPTYRAADVVYLADKLDRGFDRAIYVLGADHHGTRNWYAAVARMLGYDPERVEVLLYQLVHLTRGGEAAEDVEAPRRRRLPRRVPRRGRRRRRRAGTSSRAAPTRRSRSTSTSRRRRARRTPSTTSSTRTRGSPGSCATPRGRVRPREPPAELAGGGARADQAPGRVPRGRRGGDRAARPARDPDVRDPRRRRLPPLLPPPQGARHGRAGVPARPLSPRRSP